MTGSSDATRHVEGTDPHPLLEEEQLRAIRFFGQLDDKGWHVPTACPGWRRREMLAHLASSEDYNLSTLDGTREEYVAKAVAAGAHDLDSFNDWGVRLRANRSPTEILAELSEKSARSRLGLRERGMGEVDTMVGPYPARLQAFHLAFEAAIHNDDMGVPVSDSERSQRDGWRAAVVRFMLEEASSPVELFTAEEGTRVRASKTGDEAVFDDADLISAASGRLRERAERYPPALVEALRL